MDAGVGLPNGPFLVMQYPLKGSVPELDYILAKDAIAKGALTVKEVSDSGNVNRLIVQKQRGQASLAIGW